MDSKTIDNAAVKLLNKAQLFHSPIDVQKLAMDYLEIDLQFEELDDEVSGFLLVEGDQSTIVINDLQHPNRQRFTIAHEIGHHTLHRQNRPLFLDKQYRINRDENSSTGECLEEMQANQFAATLLMPSDLIEKEINRLQLDLMDENDAYLLANKFKVSQQAMGFRLAKLGYNL